MLASRPLTTPVIQRACGVTGEGAGKHRSKWTKNAVYVMFTITKVNRLLLFFTFYCVLRELCHDILSLFLLQLTKINLSGTMIQKFTSLFPSDFKSVFVWHLTGKILSFKFCPRLFSLSTNLGFHDPPLLTFKTDQFSGLQRVGSRIRWRL